MAYFTERQLRAALEYLSESTHPFLLSILALLRTGAPATDDPSDGVTFGSRDELALLRDYLAPAGEEGAKPYFMPFGQANTSRWRDAQYPGRSLQRIRSDHPELIQQDPLDRRRWSFVRPFVRVIEGNPSAYVGDLPIKIGALATVFYREQDFESPNSAIARFRAEFQLDRPGLGRIFEDSFPDSAAALPLHESQVPPDRVLEIFMEFERDQAGEATAAPEREPAPAVGFATRSHVAVAGEGFGDWALEAGPLRGLGGLVGVEEAAIRASAALASGMHVILTGPPGVGKTRLAEALCGAAGFPFWTVPATDQWSSFEVIGGYFPMPTPEGGGEGELEFLPGHVVESLQAGRCLVVDEINRADIDKAFGELLTLLSGISVTLPYRRRGADGVSRRLQLLPQRQVVSDDVEAIVVPPWWRMIGCMNDADKASLKRMSFAFMRRFAFVPVPCPPPEDYRRLLEEFAQRRAQRDGVPGLPAVAENLALLFTDESLGFGAIGLEFGPAIPLAILAQAGAELGVDRRRHPQLILRSGLEAFLAPQLQGRADVHEDIVGLVTPLVGDEADAFAKVLSSWTGFVAG